MNRFLLVRWLFILAMLAPLCTMAQQISVKGRVTSVDDNQGVPGAAVRVQGTTRGTITNTNGAFEINVSKGEKLSVSLIGYATKVITVTGGTVAVQLESDSKTLNEVVVTTALGQQHQAKELGYAVSTISNKTLTQAKSVGIAQALNGKISGLNISTVNSGVFEDAKISIRGIRSLTGSNQPMLVVDGAPTPLGYLSSIPPDDVQDVTVLKSAAAGAVYGPDAVNGVIIITTRRGGKNPLISVNSSLEVTRVAFFPKLQNQFGDGGGETQDAYGNFDYVPYENQQFGPRFDGSIKQVGLPLQDGSVQMLPYNASHLKDKTKFFNTGLTFQNSISIASENFYAAIQDARINGLIPNDVNHRTSFRFNGSKTIGKFSVNYGVNYILQNSSVVNESGFQNSFPGAYDGGLFFLVMQTADNIPLLQYRDQNSKFGNYSSYYNEYAVNPYWLIQNIRTNSRRDDLLGNVVLDYKILPWLKATARVSTTLSFNSSKSTNAPIVVNEWAQTFGGPNGGPRNATQYSNRPGNEFDDANYANRLNFDYFLSGEKKFAHKNFTVSYLVGSSVRQDRTKDVAVGGNNLVVPNLYNVSAKSGDANVPFYLGGTVPDPTGNGRVGYAGNNFDVESRTVSVYGTVSFAYKDWAFIEGTGRNDWDSRLLAANRSFFYPAVNASVVLSNAIDGLKNSDVLSYLKIRGALSKSGNVNINPYALNATYSQPSGYPYGTTVGYTANNVIPASNLKPEFVNTREIGAELGFLRERIVLEATYYNQNNTNQILNVSQSATTGFVDGLANAAAFKNYGTDIDLKLTPLVKIGRGVINFNIAAAYNNNKVTKTLNNTPVVLTGTNDFTQISTGSPTVNNIATVGKPAFQFQMTDNLRDGQGHVIVDPVTGFPSQAPSLAVLGRSLPLWVLGFTPSYVNGNFSITMTWDYKGGHNFYSGLGSDEDFAGISARSAEYGRQRFVFPNSVVPTTPGGTTYRPNTNVQVQDGNYGFWNSSNANYGIGTNYYASAAAWRLRELNISYSLPASWFTNMKSIKKITFSAIGKNLFLFVPKSNQWGDPEFNYTAAGNTFGVASSFQEPSGRLFGGSITVQFQ